MVTQAEPRVETESVAAAPHPGLPLDARITELLKRAGVEAPPISRALTKAERAAAGAALDAALERALKELHDNGTGRQGVIARCELVTEISRARRELDSDPATRPRVLTRLQEALSHLRGVDSLAQIVAKAPSELCRSCGFDRAIFSRVTGAHLVAQSAHFEGDDDWAENIVRLWQRERPELNHFLLESELMRRRAPALVADPVNDPRTFKPLMVATKTTSYVAAPVMPAGRVVGFLHADRQISGGEVDEVDRDMLWAFAEGFGYAAERAVLLERLRFQRRHIRQMMMSADALAGELCSDEIELAEVGASPELTWVETAAVSAAPNARLEALLTRRELDVLALMASGATNAQIADRLVIAPGTVKSHVKHVLRKLRASNRAEAVSRFMRLSAGADLRG